MMEFAAGGELFDAIVARGSYTEKDSAHVVAQPAHCDGDDGSSHTLLLSLFFQPPPCRSLNA